MNQVRIQCPKCKERARVEYRTSMGHGATDEALAINRAIKNHKCKEG